jgi:transcriptional regulator with XRE-family HTH domain
MSSSTHDLHRERHWTCARRISERRHDLNLTQYDVVERLADLGVAASNRTLSAMEHGQGVDVCRLPELAQALDCTITYLLGLTDDPRSWTPHSASAASDSAAGSRVEDSVPGWILGPDIPDRATPAAHGGHRA